jgi:hypothetical protein
MLATALPPLRAKWPIRLGLLLKSSGAPALDGWTPTATPLAVLSEVSRSRRGSSGSIPEPPLVAVKGALARVNPVIGPGQVTISMKSLPWLPQIGPGCSGVIGESPKFKLILLPLPVAAPVAATVQVGAVMVALKLTMPALACT